MTTGTQVPGNDTTQAGVQANADGVTPEAKGTDTSKDVKATDAQATDATKAAEATKEAAADYTFKTPEGVTLDKARLDDFTAIAKDLKLPAEAAQKLVDLAVKAEATRAEAHVKQAAEWAAAVKADKVLGGDKLPESVATAMKAIDLGPPELKELLNASGLGNHPAVFKWAHAVGKALSEDKFVAGKETGPTGSMADRMYGTPAKT